jgi:hypothetical protein
MSENKCRWENGELIQCDKGLAKRIVTAVDILGGFDFCPYCGSSLKKPVEIKLGMFGRFWGGLEGKYLYGVLTKIYGNEEEYEANGYYMWSNFTPGLPEGFNQDGTPKEEQDA